jgi:NitT/TauT family transport system substrate-binding protein
MRVIVRLLGAGLALLAAACAAPSQGAAPAAPAPVAAAPAAAPSGAPAAPAAPPARESIKYGYNPILNQAPMYIAQDRGYYAEQGLEVEFVPFDSGALMIPPATAGQLDVIQAVPSPSLFNALARGLPLVAVASMSRYEVYVLVRKELVDSGQVKSIEDLRGKRVSFNVEGSPVDYAMRNMFIKSGLMPDIEVVRLSNTDMPAAMANGAIQAGAVSDPVPIEKRGIGVRILRSREFVGLPASGIVAVGPSLLDRDESVTARVVAANIKGLRDWRAAIQDDRVADSAILDIISQWTRTPVDSIAETLTFAGPPDARIDLEEMNRQQDFWVAEGMVPVKTDLSQFVENKYVDAALARLR